MCMWPTPARASPSATRFARGIRSPFPIPRSPQLERALELLAAARNETRRRLYLDRRFVVYLARGLVFGLPRDANLALHHERLRPRAALGKATLHEKDVETAFHLLDELDLPDIAMRERAVYAERDLHLHAVRRVGNQDTAVHAAIRRDFDVRREDAL